MKTTLLNENKSHQKYKSWDATGIKICDLPTSHWTHGDHQVDFKKTLLDYYAEAAILGSLWLPEAPHMVHRDR